MKKDKISDITLEEITGGVSPTANVIDVSKLESGKQYRIYDPKRGCRAVKTDHRGRRSESFTKEEVESFVSTYGDQTRRFIAEEV